MQLLKMKIDLENYKIDYLSSSNISEEKKEEQEEDVAYFDPI